MLRILANHEPQLPQFESGDLCCIISCHLSVCNERNAQKILKETYKGLEIR